MRGDVREQVIAAIPSHQSLHKRLVLGERELQDEQRPQPMPLMRLRSAGHERKVGAHGELPLQLLPRRTDNRRGADGLDITTLGEERIRLP